MDTLTLALERLAFLPPTRVTDDTSVLTLKNLVLEPLCRWRDGQVLPGLFAAWEASAEGRRWHFRLRPGARFHDGSPCTAEDVQGFIEGLLGALDTFGMPWPYARYLAGARFIVPARGCLRVELPEPLADLPEILTEFYPCRPDAAGSPVLGTGPYRVADHLPGARAVLARVGDGAAPARLVALAVPDADDRHRALRDGAADLALNLERMRGRVGEGAGLRWVRATNTLSVMLYLNGSRGLFTAPGARLAANHAVDAGRIVAELFQGLGTVAASVVSPHHLGFAEAAVRPIAYDPDRARALLDAAGPCGEVLLRTPDHMPEQAPAIAAMVAESLRAVGLPVRVEQQPDRPRYAREIGDKAMGDLAIFDSSPHSTFRVLDDKVSGTTRGTWWQGHDDPLLEPLLRAARRSLDTAARAVAYGRCLARLNADPPWLYLFHPIAVLGLREGLDGFGLDHKGVLVLPP